MRWCFRVQHCSCDVHMVEQACMCFLLGKLGRMAVMLQDLMLHGTTVPAMLT